MMHQRPKLLLFISLFLYLPILSQTLDTSFLLDGSLEDIDSGIVQIWQPRSDSSFYVFKNKVPIRQGKFQFNGYLEFSQTTNLAIFENDGTFLFDSGWFYIDPGEQELNIGGELDGRKLTSDATSFNEDVKYFQPVYDSLDLIRREINREIARAEYESLGQKLLDTSRVSTSLYRMERNRFTLIDFWFNSCGFCIQQFPELRQLYERYHTKGLEIIGITVDKERFVADWKKAIRTHQLPWPQYRDLEGRQSAEYLINNFPTNFLLNDRGEIIGRNLGTEELMTFLETNL